MTRRSILFNSSNSPIPPADFMPLPTGADSSAPHPVGSEGETEAEPSGKTASEVPDHIVAPSAVSAEMADEEAAIRQEVERFRGAKSAEDFIAAVTARLKIPDLASADLDAVMRGEDPAFLLCLLDTARGVEASRRASAVRGSIAAQMLQRIRGTVVHNVEPSQPALTFEPPSARPAMVRQQGRDLEYQVKLWTDEDGYQVEVATLSQADATSKDSVLARRSATRLPLGRPLGSKALSWTQGYSTQPCLLRQRA
jgi:hypothetical protein